MHGRTSLIMSEEIIELKDRDKETAKEELLHSNNDTASDYDDIVCGVGSFRPAFLQPCAKIIPFVGFISVTSFLTSCLSTYISSQISTLERMFGFSSSISGFILSCNDIGYLLSILFATYFARRTHIPRVLCLSTVLYGVSGLVCCLPYFLTRDKFILSNMGSLSLESENISAAMPNTASNLCLRNATDFTTSASCGEMGYEEQSASMSGLTGDESKLAIGLIATGMILQGFAKAPRLPFSNIYIDDNSDRTKTALYIGIPYGFAVFGPAVSFGLGGLFSRIYVTLEDSDMSFRDTRWIGAWWLGFLVIGTASLLFAVPLYFFPKHLLPKSKRLNVKETGENKPFTLTDLKGLLQALYRLAKNPVYCPLIISQVIQSLATSGCLAFYPKFVEVQYHVPVWKAALIMGGSIVMAVCTGVFVGGKIVTKFKLSPTACMKMLAGLHVFYLFAYIAFLNLGCPQEDIRADWNAIGATYGSMLKNASCRDSCLCDIAPFLPVCDEKTGVTYYSPCHAGCSSGNSTMYTDCSCVSAGEVLHGYCPTSCSMLIPFVVVMFLATFAISLSVLNYLLITMRCVSEADKPFGIGLSLFLSNLGGWLPGPILYGWVIDTTCLVWNTTCSKVGSCAIYDTDDLRYKLHGGTLGIRVIGVLFQLFVLWKIIKSDFFSSEKGPKLSVRVERNGIDDKFENVHGFDGDESKGVLLNNSNH